MSSIGHRGFDARSWLFAPGDSARKMAKAAAGAADIVLIDLEDAVAAAEKPAARNRTADFLAAHAESDRRRLWVRVNPLDGPHTLADLAAIVPARPGGIMLPKSRGGQDVRTLDHYLSALEVAADAEPGRIEVIALAPESAEAVFTTGTYRDAPRLAALSWGVEDLAASLGAGTHRGPDGGYGFTYELARSLCLVGAASAGVAAIDTIHGDYRDLDGVRARAEKARREGFRGMLAIHPDQVDIINAAFAPSVEELAAAQEIVDLFAADPETGAIGYRGGLLDRPHLARAQALLATRGQS
ncbi:HpcH/HpaI aldolase/citrate lyase family protein [Nocardia sp. NPDC056541]|uniref:HpcH/HpaI aldolase/citrate lyase family protein n=1 Tax=Nocardia sp. NPDC056541 TaxID=3345860 RepID=UPI00366C953D